MSIPLMPFPATFQLVLPSISQPLYSKPRLLSPFVNTIKLKTDLLTSELLNNPSKEADTLYEQYHTTLSTLIDKYAPPHTKNT